MKFYVFIACMILVYESCCMDVSNQRLGAQCVNQRLRVKLQEIIAQWNQPMRRRASIIVKQITNGSYEGCFQVRGVTCGRIVHRLQELVELQGFVLHRLAIHGYRDVFSFIVDEKLVSSRDLELLLNVPLQLPNYLPAALVALQTGSSVGVTPLHLAAHYGHVDLAKALLDHGAGVDVQDKQHRTPLFVAVQQGHHAMVRLLLESGAQVNELALGECVSHHVDQREPRFAQTSALCVAAAHDDLPMMELLAEKGAQVNVQEPLYETPLHHAAAHGACRSARWLLAHKADITRKTKCGFTATDIAFGLHQEHIAVLLMAAVMHRPQACNS